MLFAQGIEVGQVTTGGPKFVGGQGHVESVVRTVPRVGSRDAAVDISAAKIRITRARACGLEACNDAYS